MNCACGCSRTVPYTRGAKYATARCRAEASRKRREGIPGIVRSVRRLKSGKVSIIVHVLPLWAGEARVRQRGDDISVRVG